MSHLPAALLVMLLAFPGGGAAAFACAAAVLQGDCCPEGATAPCTGSDPTWDTRTSAATCCIVAPSPAQATSMAPVRVEHEQQTDSGSPELPIPSAWANAFAQVVELQGRPFIVDGPAVSDAAPIYLRTRRLRL